MRFGTLAVVGFVVAVASQAQQGSLSQAQLSRSVVLGPGCPGQLQARQQASGGATVWTTAVEDQKDKDAANNKRGLGVHVEFQGANTPVRTLELRVSYEPLGLKRMPLAPGTNGFVSTRAVREKNFNLDREASMRVEGDLLVGRAATITSVHLLSATFADGSVWHAPTQDACSVVPDHMLLVNAK